MAGCANGSAAAPQAADPAAPRATLADDDAEQPSYGMPELQEALIAERARESAAARRVSELEARQADGAGAAVDDSLRAEQADLAVRRRFIASLEACQQQRRGCPPRLDDPAWSYDADADMPTDPPLTSVLRFDVASWRTLAGELHGRACACRTMACIDTVGVAIDRLELRPMPQVRGDEAASASITQARECLFRLRGKSALPRPAPLSED